MPEVVIASIGNPGAVTRHSVGHLMLHQLLERYSANELRKRGPYSYSYTSDQSIAFVRSNVYMNDSNKAISQAMKDLRVSAETPVLIIHDDFESPLGSVKLNKFKKNESHNGIKSVKNGLGGATSHVFKLSIGVGPKPYQASSETMSSWVLSELTLEEEQKLQHAVVVLDAYINEYMSRDGEVDFGKFNSRMTKRVAVK